MKGSSGRRWLRWLERGIALLVLGFLIAYLVENWNQVREYEWRIDWGRMSLAVLLHAAVYTGYVVLWRHVLLALGARLSLVDAHRIWYLANLGRYVPGKVLQLAGIAYLARSKGVSPVVGVASTIVSQMFVLATGFAVAVVALPEAAERVAWLEPVALVSAAILFVVLLTPAFDRLYHRALRLGGRAEHHVEVAWTTRLALTVGYTALWIAFGTAFWLFVGAVADLAAGAYWPVVGTWVIGYLAGWIVVFVPGGLGVREGVYAGLLALYIPLTIAVATSVLARVWSTAVELAIAGGLLARYGLADLRAGAPPEPRDAHG
ncbi:MAG: lysylphosphatidylglycerol synthase transmembrane domain-containing protein [Gemmatimonadota bacterium]|nr:lysylphosphatidylglycerol synthase transmembrane domain-containing protein [Gemmatimonadota bacterium]